LARTLKISPQAIHRHLKVLVANGIIERVGIPPRVGYAMKSKGSGPSATGVEMMRQCAKILRRHPKIRLVTLFGSYARGRERANSDIDVMVWLAADAKEGRREIWDFWDTHSKALAWRDNVSMIVGRLTPIVQMHTLLLDLPEEHQVIFDRENYFALIKAAICSWRERNGAVKIPSFGDTHAWKYTDKAVGLDQIDFDLELGDVA